MRACAVTLALALLMVSLPTEWAVAQANHRSAVDRQHKQAQTLQQKQDRLFKAIERDAELLLKDVAGRHKSLDVAPSGARSQRGR